LDHFTEGGSLEERKTPRFLIYIPFFCLGRYLHDIVPTFHHAYHEPRRLSWNQHLPYFEDLVNLTGDLHVAASALVP